MEIHSRFVSPSSLLIFAYTVNKKHDSGVIRVTCYLLTRWQKFSQDALKIRFKKKIKIKIMEGLTKHAQGENITCLLPENTFLWKAAQRESVRRRRSCRTFERKTNDWLCKCWHFYELLQFSSCLLEYSSGINRLSVLQMRLFFSLNLKIQSQLKYVLCIKSS